MKKTKKRALYIVAALIAALFVAACLAGFAACGGGGEEPEPEPEPTPAATVSSVSITPTSLSLKMGATETGTLTATVTMSDNTTSASQTVTWKSFEESVATVTSTGYTTTVTAVSAGTTKITATAGGVTSAECTVTVDSEDPTLSIALSPTPLKIATGSSSSVTATLAMSDGSEVPSGTSVEWSVGKTGVVSLSDATNASVTVTGLGIGTDTITATAGEAAATCSVSVTEDTALTLEAEDAALMNAVGSTTENLMKAVEEDTAQPIDGDEPEEDVEANKIVTNVTAGDMVVFQVLASDDIENVAITVNVPNDADVSDLELYVNGSETAETLTNGKGAISLEEGANYIVLTVPEPATEPLDAETTSASVDSIELEWTQEEVTTTSSSIFGSSTTVSIEPTIELLETGGDIFEIGSTGRQTLEAEDAALMNAVGASGDTNLLKTEVSGSTGVTQVADFNLKGDKIVFQVYASTEMTGIDLGAWVYPSTKAFDASEHSKFITVNGQDVSATGSLPQSAYGEVAASGITLKAGINYIEITLDVSGTILAGMNLGFMNVDRVDLTWVSATASDESTLRNALNSDNVIELTADISSLTSSLTVAANVDATIDLNGKTISTGTLSSATNTIEVAEGATLTITDSTGTGSIENAYETATSTDNAAAIETKGTLVINGGTVESSSVGVRALEGSVVINGGTVTSTSYYALWEGEGTVDVTINGGIVGGSYAGILVDGDSCFGYGNYNYQYGAVTTLTVTGGVVYSGGESQAAIRTEGMTSTDSAIITIEGGIVYGAEAAPGIFLGNGTLTITDGYIVGSTACEVQAGKVTISGGTFVATETTPTIDTSSSNNASYTNGYALAIIPRGYIVRCTDTNEDSANFSMALDAEVTGGTFVGDVYVANSATSASATGDWTVSFEKDETGSSNYVVIMPGIELVGYISSNQLAIGEETVAYYLWEYEDLTSNFVTGTRAQNSTIPDAAYTVGGVLFTGSEVTSVERVGTTYIVSGTAAAMSPDQVAAFWGDEADNHGNASYIMILITADESNPYTIYTEKNPEGVEMTGVDPYDGYFICFDVTSATEGTWICTIVDAAGVSFDVVFGTINPATT